MRKFYYLLKQKAKNMSFINLMYSLIHYVFIWCWQQIFFKKPFSGVVDRQT